MRKEYVKPDELDVLTVREKAIRHLSTWSKKRLIDQLALGSKDGWLQKWAEEYDREVKKESK